MWPSTRVFSTSFFLSSRTTFSNTDLSTSAGVRLSMSKPPFQPAFSGSSRNEEGGRTPSTLIKRVAKYFIRHDEKIILRFENHLSVEFDLGFGRPATCFSICKQLLDNLWSSNYGNKEANQCSVARHPAKFFQTLSAGSGLSACGPPFSLPVLCDYPPGRHDGCFHLRESFLSYSSPLCL
jgi:hypothetical protein